MDKEKLAKILGTLSVKDLAFLIKEVYLVPVKKKKPSRMVNRKRRQYGI
jgi:hypothetical protein